MKKRFTPLQQAFIDSYYLNECNLTKSYQAAQRLIGVKVSGDSSANAMARSLFGIARIKDAIERLKSEPTDSNGLTKVEKRELIKSMVLGHSTCPNCGTQVQINGKAGQATPKYLEIDNKMSGYNEPDVLTLNQSIDEDTKALLQEVVMHALEARDSVLGAVSKVSSPSLPVGNADYRVIETSDSE